MLVMLRISLPDRPGALGSVATSLSHMGADIVHVSVVDRQDGYAVDQICVEVGDDLDAGQLRKAAEAIPGVVVEAIRRVTRVPDPLAALVLAERLARSDGQLVEQLVSGLPEALTSAWCMALDVADDVRVLASTPDAPVPASLQTPWMPLVGARRLEAAEWMPTRWMQARLELAAASLGSPTACVIVGRWTGMSYRPSELRQLEILSDLAVRDRPRDAISRSVRVTRGDLADMHG